MDILGVGITCVTCDLVLTQLADTLGLVTADSGSSGSLRGTSGFEKLVPVPL